MSIRDTVLAEFAQVGIQLKTPVPELTDQMLLADTGLDSLGFAIMVARLDDTLGVDPFSQFEELEVPTTVGDFIALYEGCLM